VALTAASTTKPSVAPATARPPGTSEIDDIKGLKSKQKDCLLNPELPEKTAATATPELQHYLSMVTQSVYSTFS
jgi:hypothetical protein